MIIKSSKYIYRLRIDLHRTQSPLRSNVFKLFLKVTYVFIFRDSPGIAFQNIDAAYLHVLKPKVVDYDFGRSSIMVPLRYRWSTLLS